MHSGDKIRHQIMDVAHKDHLHATLHRFLRVAALLLCLLAQVLVLASRLHTALCIVIVVSAMLLLIRRHRGGRSIGLADFSCLKPQRRLRTPVPKFLEHLKLNGCFQDESVEIMCKAVMGSGMGDETYFPAALHYIPPDATHANAIEEAHALFVPTLDELFAKTGVPPSAVGALIVNCSGFCPAPSLSAIVANHYRMSPDVKTFNLSGMGCSGGVVAVDVAANVLGQHASISYAVVVSAEVITVGWYNGRDHRKLLLNCFFRTGCSAALITNGRAGVQAAKYKLVRLVRSNQIAVDDGYYSGYRDDDDEGITGFTVERNVGKMFAEVLRAHLVALGKSVLPWREQLRYMAAALVLSTATVPDFRTAVEHFCLPVAGRQHIVRLGKRGLGLREEEMEAALMTFHRFGNQSAASLWYQLAYLEAKGRVRKGDRVWQLGVGSGLKANSMVWERVGAARPQDMGPWIHCIHRYPVAT